MLCWPAFVGLGAAPRSGNTHKPLPPGTHIEGAWLDVPPRDLEFIADITAADAYGRRMLSQAIFDEVLGIVRSAREFLVLDYFLFNDQRGTAAQTHAGARAVARAARCADRAAARRSGPARAAHHRSDQRSLRRRAVQRPCDAARRRASTS